MTGGRSPRVVAIGGGTGLATALRAIRHYASDVTAIVTVADDGGSSGELSRTLGILPPGDLRKCLLALLPRGSSRLSDLLEYRFPSGPLRGHALGNLVIAALADLEGGMSEAVEWLGRLLGTEGRVLPVCRDPVRLVAETDRGVLVGQHTITNSQARILRVRLDPENPPATAGVLETIEAADQIVLGPGSLFTSVIPPLLAEGVTDAIRSSKATVVYVCNLICQPGETSGLSVADHLGALLSHGIRIDAVIYHPWGTDAPPGAVQEGDLEKLGVLSWPCDVARADQPHLHRPEALAAALAALFESSVQVTGRSHS